MFIIQFPDGSYRRGRGEYHKSPYYHTDDIKKARVYRLASHAHASMRTTKPVEYKLIELDVTYPN